MKGKRLVFGMEGSWRGTATMYDRATRSLWLQLTGECIAGTYEGTVLQPLQRTQHTSWGAWRALHSDTQVMARRTANLRKGHEYPGREAARSGSPAVPLELKRIVRTDDRRLEPHALVYGVRVGDAARAYPFSLLQATPVVEEDVGGRDVTVWFDAASRSAVAFSRSIRGRTLSFHFVRGGEFEDDETHSHWTMEGRCVKGPLRGAELEPVHGFMCEWYGWASLRPETTIWGL